MTQADLGQHLLRDAEIIADVVAAAEVRAGESVMDAGAGGGALTRPLAEAVGPSGRVYAVEVDPVMIERLRARMPPQVEVVPGDLLEVPLPDPLHAVVANPPFKIAAPVVERIVEARVPRSVLVLPRELVDRLTARPGMERYGKLTIRVAIAAHTRFLGPVPRRAFDPVPGVACAAVLIRARPDAIAVDPAALRQVLDAAWEAWERKAKHAFAPLAPAFRADSAAFMRMLKDAGWAEERPSMLPPDAYAAIAAHLREHGKA